MTGNLRTRGSPSEGSRRDGADGAERRRAARVIFIQLCNVLDPGVAVAFSSASSELWELTQAPRQHLKADYEAAAALGRKAGKRSCKELRDAKAVLFQRRGVSSDDRMVGTSWAGLIVEYE